MDVHERLLRIDSAYRLARIASENNHRRFRASGLLAARPGITTIQIVVHVVHNTNEQSLSVAQVQSQIDVLNRDFRMRNPDVSSVPTPFKPLAADARVEFKLATVDPQGNPTNGITRTQTTRAGFSVDDDGIKSVATGGADAWPADRYLNIWTAPNLPSPQGPLLGYAQFPGGPAATDGVVILHSAFGTMGTARAPFHLGRTTTHEVGHYLNLRHIWGDDGDGCNGRDFVDDTPNQGSENFGEPTFPNVSCGNAPNGDLFMNYMDYVDDVAMFMFTAGQVERMQACLDSDRSAIGTAVQRVAEPVT
ncbi:MAG: zinc metalloprotease [Pseudomonadota bacterium]|nr:zinc metalloprotease [Pseudomonadota bacterium]